MNELTSIMDKNGKYLNMKHLNDTIIYACMNVCMCICMLIYRGYHLAKKKLL